MGTKMKNAPVFFTVAQIRFNPILDLDNYLPKIQDQMRTAQFTDFKQEVSRQITIPFGNTDVEHAIPATMSQPRYKFGNIERDAGFLLENNSLSFQTTAYDTFGTFSNIFLKGLKTLDDILNLDFTERVGLRYLDAVLPKTKDESLSDYLVTEILGLSEKSLGKLFAHSLSETVSFITAGHLVSRVVIQNGRVGLPPELTGLVLKVKDCFIQPEGLHAILDNDAFYEQREKFDLSLLENRLEKLHDEIDNSFKAMVTDHALSNWS